MPWCQDCDFRDDTDWDICPECNSPRETPKFMGSVKDFYDSAKKLLAQEELVQKGNKAYEDKDWEEAERCYLACLEVTRKREASIEAELLFILGRIAFDQGDLNKAQKLYQDGLEFNRNIGDEQLVARTLLSIGDFQEHGLEDPVEAEKSYRESLALFRKVKDKKWELELLIILGHFTINGERVDEAEKWYQDGLELSIDLEDRQNESNLLHNLGNVHLHRGELESAKKMYLESLEIQKEFGYQKGEASSMYYLGKVIEKMGDQEEADKLFRESADLFGEIGNEE